MSDRPIGEDDLQGFVDGRLSPERQATVETFLSAHPQVAEQVFAYREQRAKLRDGLAFKAEEPIPARLRVEAIASGNRRRATGRLAAAAASLALFAAGGVAGWSANAWLGGSGLPALHGARTPVPNDAFAAHRTFVVEVVHPVEVGAAQEQHLVQWLSKRLGRPLRAPDLNGRGFQLMGGRLLPGDERPAAQFMYENRSGARITLYVQAAGNGETSFRFARDGDMSAFFWVESGFAYAIVAALDRELLLGLAEDVYGQLAAAGPDRPKAAL